MPGRQNHRVRANGYSARRGCDLRTPSALLGRPHPCGACEKALGIPLGIPRPVPKWLELTEWSVKGSLSHAARATAAPAMTSEGTLPLGDGEPKRDFEQMLDLNRLSLIQNFVDRVGASCTMQGTIHEEPKVEFGVGSGSQSNLMRRP